MTETIQGLINEAITNGWDYDKFEADDDKIVVQVWPHAMTMYEYIFDGVEGFAIAGYLHIPGFEPNKLF